MPSGKPDYYELLGVFRDAPADEIKRAYFEAAQKLHPDKNVAAGETEVFLEVQQAYEVLSNPKRRKLYDATLPPEIKSDDTINVEVIFSRPSFVQIGEGQLIYTLLEISAKTTEKNLPSPPLNLCLVMDRSTSMKGERLDMVKATAIQLTRKLRPQDILSIVAFSDRAEVIIPASVTTDKRSQENRIQMIQASGSTEIYQGLEAGLNEINRTFDPSRVNHLIMLTDGKTYGDERDCLKLAEIAAERNIGITGMGIGHEWNDIFLDELTSKTGGSSMFIKQPGDIERFLVEKFNALTNIFAEDVQLDYKQQKDVLLNYAFRLQPDGGHVDTHNPIHLGSMQQDVPLEILLEHQISPDALTEKTLTFLEGILKISIAARPVPVPPIRLKLTREVVKHPSADPPPTRILSALSRLTLYRMQERARNAVDAGEFEVAVRHLQSLATNLLSQGENSLARTALFEAENLEKMHKWSKTGNKDIKYSTRALLLSGAQEKR